MSKVTVVGAGNVGATCVNALAIREIAGEVVLLDIKEGLAEGRADIARNMIRESFPLEKVAQLTGLSQDDVRRIAAEMAED